MDFEKSKRFLLKLAACYWALVLIIYAAAYPQFRNEVVTSDVPGNDGIVGEVVDGLELRQKVMTEADRLDSVSILSGTYARTNTGTIVLTLEDEAGQVLASAETDISLFADNVYTTIPLSEPLKGQAGRRLTLVISSRNCEPGNAVTFYTGSLWESTGQPVDETDFVRINGEPGSDMLCVRLNGVRDLNFYIVYWFIVIGVFLIAALLCTIWWRQAMKGKNNPLVMVCTLATRYQLLFRQLVSRDFKTKYKRSMLGMLWSFLNPLLTMGVQYIVFSTLFKSDIANYPVYLMIGIVFFNFFSEAISMGMTSITGNASLIKKVYLPKYIFPISRVASSLINFGLALIPLFLIVLLTGVEIRPSILLLIFDIICLVVFITGMSLLLTTSMTFFQDTQFLWGVIVMIWMYMTPIFYPESIIPEKLSAVYRLNPLYQYITFARICVIDGISPPPRMYLSCIVSSLVTLALGVMFFRRHQDRFILYL